MASSALRSLRVPLQQPHFDASAFELLLERVHIAGWLAAIVVGNDDLGVKCLYRIGSLFRRHGVRQIRANKSHIDVLERLHFRNSLGITRNIEALAAISENVAIAPALRSEERRVGNEGRRRSASEE